MKLSLWVYVRFSAVVWLILGRTREARFDAPEAAEVVCSVRMVLPCAIAA